jgi:Type IV secretion-system coupling protein DNA-binding domain
MRPSEERAAPRSGTRAKAGGLAANVAALVERKHAQLVARHPALAAPVPHAELPVPTDFDAMALVLGRDDAGAPIVLPERPRLEHMHVIGATGSGKTNLLEHMIRQDVIHGRGVCVVDPHGNHPDSLYRSLLSWLDRKGFTKSRVIHLIDPNAGSHAVGFNPLGRPDADTSYSVIAEAMFEAFSRMWGDEDGNTKPTIQRVLTATFTALSEQGLTLAEARLLFDPDDTHGIRALVLRKLRDSYAHDEIDWLHHIGEERTGRRDFRAEVVGPINRIAKLVRNEAVRAIVGQTERVLDLRDAMDENHVILANLSGARWSTSKRPISSGACSRASYFFMRAAGGVPSGRSSSTSTRRTGTYRAICPTFSRKSANTVSA